MCVRKARFAEFDGCATMVNREAEPITTAGNYSFPHLLKVFFDSHIFVLVFCSTMKEGAREQRITFKEWFLHCDLT